MRFYVYRISELAKLVGLSRTALLYYEKLNLISAKRLENGYRVYSERDAQQVRLIQQLSCHSTLAAFTVILLILLLSPLTPLEYDL